MLSAEHREHAKRSTFFKVYLVETVIQQGYKPSIFQQLVFCLLVSLLVSKGKKPSNRLNRTQQYLLKSNSQMKALHKLYSEKEL